MSDQFNFESDVISDPNAAVESSNSPDTTPDQQQAVIPQTSEGQADNPAWQPLLSELPDVFREKAKPHLTKWDQNYRDLETKYKDYATKYTPYEPYVGVPPESLQYGLNLLQLVNTNPQLLYGQLQEYLRANNLLPQEQQVPDAQTDPNAQSLDENPEAAELRKQQEELATRQQQLENYIQTQQHEKLVSQYKDTLNTEIDAFRQSHPGMDEDDLVARIKMQVDSGQKWDIEAAYRDQVATFQRIYQRQTAARQAPQIIPSNGTIAPTEAKSPADMNYEERMLYMKSLIDAGNTR